MNQESLLNNYHQYFPYSSPNISDEEKWEQLQSLAEQSGYKLPEFEEPSEYIYDVRENIDSNFKSDLKNNLESNKKNLPPKLQGDYSPGGFNSVFEDWSAANIFAESGDPLGLGSEDYWKYVYNNSMAGLWYKTHYGKDRYQYENEEYDPGVLGHISAFFTSLASPLDAASLLMGGSAGRVASKGVGKSLLNKWGKDSLEEITKKQLKNKVGRYNWATGAAELGGNLATYTGAHASLGSAARQVEENGKVDFPQLMADTGHAILESGLVGLITGGLVKGNMATQYAYSKLAKNPGLKQELTQLATNPLSQVGTEALAFTTIPHLLAEAGIPTVHSKAFSDETFSWDDYLKGLGTNLGIIGSMKLISRARSPKDKDIVDIVKTAYNIANAENIKIRKSNESVRDNLMREGIDPGELINEITNSNIKERGYLEEKEYLVPIIKELQVYQRKGYDNLNEAERAFLLKYGVIGDGALSITRSISDFLADKERYFEGLEGVLSKKQGKRIKLSENEKDAWVQEMLRIKEVHEYAKEQANASAIGREVFWDKPWAKEDAEIIFAKNDFGQGKYWIKTKDRNEHLFEKLEFDSEVQAQRYLDSWFKNMKEDLGEEWMAEKSGKEVEIDENYIDIQSKKADKSLRQQVEEAKKRLLEEETEADRIDIEGAPEGTVKMAKVSPTTNLPIYITEGLTFETIDVPFSKVEEYKLKNYNTEKDIILRQKGGKAVPLSPESAQKDMLFDEASMRKLIKEATETKALKTERMEHETLEKIVTDIELKGDWKFGMPRMGETIWGSGAKEIKGSPHQFFTGPKSTITGGAERSLKERWESLPKGSKERKFMVHAAISTVIKPQHKKSFMNEGFKFIEFIDKNQRKSFSDINYNDIREYLFKENRKVSENILKHIGYKGPPIYRNILEGARTGAFNRFKEFIRLYTGGDKEFVPKFGDKLRGKSSEIEALFKDVGSIINEKIIGTKQVIIPGQKEPVQFAFPAISGVRRATKNIGQNLSKITGKEEYNLVAELGAKYYLRREEVNALTSKEAISKNGIAVKQHGNDYYLDLKGKLSENGYRKDKSFDRKVWIESSFGKSLEEFIINNGSFKGITKEIGRELAKYRTGKGNKVTNNRAEVAFNDLRKRGELRMVDEKLSAGEMEKFHWMMGHEIPRIGKIYRAAEIKNMISDQKLFQSSINKGLAGYKSEVRFQRTVTGKAPTLTQEATRSFIEKQIRQNKGVKVNISAEDFGYAGRYYKGTIDIVLGKADMGTWFHENAHRLQDYIYSVGDKGLIKLWETAESRFKGDATKEGYYRKFKDKKEAMDEFMADKISEWSLKQEMPRSLKQRIGNFVKRLWSKTKQALFGKESLTEKDIIRILGEKAWKGFKTDRVDWGGLERFQVGDINEMIKTTKKLFRETMHKGLAKGQEFSDLNWKDLKTLVAEAAGLENPEAFSWKNVNIEDIAKFRDALQYFKGGRAVLATQRATEIKERLRVNDARVRAGITDKEQANILKVIGVKDGKIDSANNFEFNTYKETVSRLAQKIPKRYDESLDEDVSSNILNSKGMGSWMKRVANKLPIMPTFAVIEMLGLKKISSKMMDHMSMELDNSRPFKELEDFAVKRVGKGSWEGGVLKTGIQDMLYLVDHKRYIDRRDQNLLTLAEKKFVKRTFTDEYLNAKNPVKTHEIDRLVRRTNEGNIVRKYNTSRLKIKDMFKNTLKSLLNKAELEKFINDNNVKWIEDGIYYTRTLSKEYKQFVNPGSKAAEKLIREEADRIESKLISEEPRGVKITEERYQQIKDAAYAEAETNFINAHHFGSVKFSSPHLLSRHPKLPERVYVPEKGDFINVYETKWETSGKKYFLSMAKLLANMEMFPEYVSLKGAKFPGVKTAISKLGLMGPEGKKYENFVNKAIETQLGISEVGSPFDLPVTFAEKTATWLAKTQLSAITSGFKNLVLGTQMTISTFGMKDFLSGLIGALSRENRYEIKMSGHTEVGIRHLDRTSKGLGIADKIFMLGGMKPTEDINRYVAVLAGKNHFNRQVKLIQRHKKGTRHYDRAKESLDTFYKMSNRQIKLLREYGVEGAITSKKSVGESSEIQRNLDIIYQKANAMAHINTQGASLQLFMPEAFGKKWIKPLTLYKRMAYGATTNTLRNIKDASKDIRAGKIGGVIKLAMQAIGPYYAGEAMLGMYHFLFGEDAPKENSDWWDRFTAIMWKGELGGILSDAFSPFGDKDMARNTLNPAIISYLINMQSHLTGVFSNKKTFKQFLEDVSKQTFAVHNAYLKVVRRKLNPYNKGFIRYNKLWDDFVDEVGPSDVGGVDFRPGRDSKYYRDIRDAWNGDGPTEEFVRLFMSVVLEKATQRHEDWNGGVYSLSKSIDLAAKSMEDLIINDLNPNPALFKISSKAEKKRKQLLFVKWLSKDPEKFKEYQEELVSLTKEHHKRISKFKSLLLKYRNQKGI